MNTEQIVNKYNNLLAKKKELANAIEKINPNIDFDTDNDWQINNKIEKFEGESIKILFDAYKLAKREFEAFRDKKW
jgi:hypothetical protein